MKPAAQPKSVPPCGPLPDAIADSLAEFLLAVWRREQAEKQSQEPVHDASVAGKPNGK